MKVLDDSNIAAIVASRFDELIVDEFQDTSDVQQAAIKKLIDASLYSVVYVGDMDQSIYGFAHANPEELQRLAGETTSETLELDENWRSSQAICDVTHRFSSQSTPNRAVGPHSGAGIQPGLIVYPDDREQDAVTTFSRRLGRLGISEATAVVLCRWTATQDALRGARDTKLGRGLQVLVKGAAAIQTNQALDQETIRDVENLVLSFVDEDADLDALDADDRLDLRLAVMKLLDGLPGFDVASSEWSNTARQVVKGTVARMTGNEVNVGGRIRTPRNSGHLTMREIVGGPDDVPPVRTIHSVKGESHCATLVIAVDSEHLTPNWTSWLGGADPEEIRVAYVALTRAQRYTAIALPASCSEEIIGEYIARGFVRTPVDVSD